VPQPQQTPPQAPPPQAPSESVFEKDLKENPCFADFVKFMGLKLVGIKQETKNGHAANATLNAENAEPNEENSREFAEPEL
jgi:hypothetical protein